MHLFGHYDRYDGMKEKKSTSLWDQDRYDGMIKKKSISLWDDIWLPREIPIVGADDDIFFKSAPAGVIGYT